jgi:hypothetical protein
MALTDTDRRRIIAATALTLLALPALWWANTSENNSTSPNLAVAGIEPVGDAGASASAPRPDVESPQDLDEVPPVFLEGPASAAGAGQSEIAVPAKPLIEGVAAEATFRSDVPTGTCIVAGMTSGSLITVVNLDNNRSTSCMTILAPGYSPDDLVMNTTSFAGIADLTDAPISVEIRR